MQKTNKLITILSSNRFYSCIAFLFLIAAVLFAWTHLPFTFLGKLIIECLIVAVGLIVEVIINIEFLEVSDEIATIIGSLIVILICTPVILSIPSIVVPHEIKREYYEPVNIIKNYNTIVLMGKHVTASSNNIEMFTAPHPYLCKIESNNTWNSRLADSWIICTK